MKIAMVLPGEWVLLNGTIRLVIGTAADGDVVIATYRSSDFHAVTVASDVEVTHLPDCTGWDYELPPINAAVAVVVEAYLTASGDYTSVARRFTRACEDMRSVLGPNFDRTIRIAGLLYQITTDSQGNFDVNKIDE